MPDSSPLPPARGSILVYPTPEAPLAGLTLLAVEDSRFASDALRLMAQRSGARLRRAETLADARHHLRVYRPDLVIVDPGLPDGDGLTLVAQIAGGGAGAPPVLVTSGRPELQAAAMAAGAAGFAAKPLAGLSAFRAAVMSCLPERALTLPRGGPAGDKDLPDPDPLALHDDLARAARQLALGPNDHDRSYLAGFVAGLARATGDIGLAEAAAGMAQSGPQSMRRLARAIADRLQGTQPDRLIAPRG
jgi:DNA-binding NarL/FixJ family response regulator